MDWLKWKKEGFQFQADDQQGCINFAILPSSISRDGSKKINIRTCEHMILGQRTMGAR